MDKRIIDLALAGTIANDDVLELDGVAGSRKAPYKAVESKMSVNAKLSKWFKGGISGKTIWFIGDSTTSNAATLFTRLAYHQGANGPMQGTTILNKGENGASTAVFLADGVTNGITASIAAQADLYVFDYGINDVRLGATSQAALEALIVDAVERLRAGVPTACIVLRMPNIFWTTDPGATGFVNPLASAATYSGYLKTTYRNLANRWPDVVLFDSHRLIYGETPPATSTLLANIIHAGVLGQTFEADELVKLIGYPTPFTPALASDAKSVSIATPWTTYQRAVEDPLYYDLVWSGVVGDSGSGFIRLAWTDPAYTMLSIQKGDVIAPAGLAPFIASGINVRFGDRIVQLGMTSPVALVQGMPVKVYRDRYYGDDAIRLNVDNTVAFPKRVRIIVDLGGTNFFDLVTFTGDNDGYTILSQIAAADTVLAQGLAAIVLTGATFGRQGGGIRVFKTGDFSAYTGKFGYLFLAALRNGQIPGSATNDNAIQGNIGEIVTNAVASGAPVALTTTVAANVTSISLIAGDWDVAGNVNFAAAAATITALSAGVTSTSATVPVDGTEIFSGLQTVTATLTEGITVSRKRISLAATTTIYLVAKATFSAGAVSAFGSITARRVR